MRLGRHFVASAMGIAKRLNCLASAMGIALRLIVSCCGHGDRHKAHAATFDTCLASAQGIAKIGSVCIASAFGDRQLAQTWTRVWRQQRGSPIGSLCDFRRARADGGMKGLKDFVGIRTPTFSG